MNWNCKGVTVGKLKRFLANIPDDAVVEFEDLYTDGNKTVRINELVYNQTAMPQVRLNFHKGRRKD